MRQVSLCRVTFGEWITTANTYVIHIYPQRYPEVLGHCRYSLAQIPAPAFTDGLVAEWLRALRGGSDWWVLSYYEYLRRTDV